MSLENLYSVIVGAAAIPLVILLTNESEFEIVEQDEGKKIKATEEKKFSREEP